MGELDKVIDFSFCDTRKCPGLRGCPINLIKSRKGSPIETALDLQRFKAIKMAVANHGRPSTDGSKNHVLVDCTKGGGGGWLKIDANF